MVRAEFPATIGAETDTALIDTLPEMLDCIAEFFERKQDTGILQEIEAIASIHAKSRAKLTQYTINQVLAEYHILRRIVVDFLIESGGLTNEGRRIINEAIDRGIAHAGKAFFDYWSAQLQSNIEQLEAEGSFRECLIHALSHDLRNPIATTSANIQLAKKEAQAKGTIPDRPLTIALQALDRMNRMIQELLDVGSTKEGHPFPVWFEETEISNVIRQMLNEMRGRYGERFIFEPEPILASVDPIALRRAVENLVINGIKYGASDAPVTITTKDLGENFSVSVFNRGNPISSVLQREIFKPFQRGDFKGAQEGWGIGLFLVKSVAEAHQGRVDLESSEELGGSRFTLILPKKQIQQKAA